MSDDTLNVHTVLQLRAAKREPYSPQFTDGIVLSSYQVKRRVGQISVLARNLTVPASQKQCSSKYQASGNR